MTGIRKLLILLCLMLSGSFAFAHDPSLHSTPVEEVRKVLQQNALGFEKGDFKSLDALWAHSSNVTVFESGHANYGWEDYRDNHLKPEVEEMKNVSYKLSNIEPKVSADTAWATFKYTIAADYKGSRVDAAGLGTAVLEKDKEGWKIVHWHTSSPRKPPETKTPKK